MKSNEKRKKSYEKWCSSTVFTGRFGFDLPLLTCKLLCVIQSKHIHKHGRNFFELQLMLHNYQFLRNNY